MRKLLVFTLSVCAGVAVFMGWFLYTKTQSVETPGLTPVAPTTFSIESPPSQSVRGAITALSGEVRWQSRIATESARINAHREVVQGERIETGKDGLVSLQFGSSVRLEVSENSAIDFIQTLPQQTVFSQSAGSVIYENRTADPIAVRVLHLLIEQQEGIIDVVIQENRPMVALTVKEGTARVGYNDLYYNSTTLDLRKGQKFYFNDETRKTDVE